MKRDEKKVAAAKVAEAIEFKNTKEIEIAVANLRDEIEAEILGKLELAETRKETIDEHFRARDSDFAARQELAISSKVAEMETRRLERQSKTLAAFVGVAGLGLAGAIGFAWTSIQNSVSTQLDTTLTEVRTTAEATARDTAAREIEALTTSSNIITQALADALEAQRATTASQVRAELAEQQTNTALSQVQSLLRTIEDNRVTIDALQSAQRARDLVRQALQDDDMLALFEGQMSSYITPSGAVAAFNTGRQEACPVGWTLFEPALGRMIIGAGSRIDDELSEYPSLEDDADRAIGGQEFVQLEERHLPEHDHSLFARPGAAGTDYPNGSQHVALSASFNSGGLTNPNFEYQLRPGSGEANRGVSGTSGENVPHNNMPPYIALYLCQKD